MNNKILELMALFSYDIKEFFMNKVIIIEEPDDELLWGFDEF